MLDLAATPEFIEGGVVAVICVISVLFYLNFVDDRLMECDRPLGNKLTITPNFRFFIAICSACSVVTSIAILKMGFAGTTSELLFALGLSLIVNLIVCCFAIPVFLTSIHVSGDTVTTRSPLGQKQVNLGNLRSIAIKDRIQLELSDQEGTVRFCHYVQSKRALLEHIVEHAPANTTQELRKALQQADKKKSANTAH